MAFWHRCRLAPLLLLLLAVAGCKAFDRLSEDSKVTDRNLRASRDYSISERAGQTWRSATGRGPSQEAAEEEFKKGVAFYKDKKYVKAAARFEEAALRWPESALEEDALFMQAESLYFADRYHAAIGVYEKLLKHFENTRHLDIATRRMFTVARYWETEAEVQGGMLPNFTDPKFPTLAWQGSASSIYSTIHLNDPTGPLAPDTLMARGNLAFRNQDFKEADYYYEQLRRDYPNSDHQAKAHLLSVESKLAGYQGPMYEDSGLEGAEKLSQRAVRQFATELTEEERQALVSAQDEVHLLKARRQFEMGEYYYKNEFYRSASIYYHTVLEEFSDTPYRALAQQRMDQVAQLPPQGPNRYIWLAKPFQWAGLERKDRF